MQQYISEPAYSFEPKDEFSDLPRVRGTLGECLSQLDETAIYLPDWFDCYDGVGVYDTYRAFFENVKKTCNPAIFEIDLTVIDNAGSHVCTFIVKYCLYGVYKK